MDKELFAAIEKERERQENGIELIASENFVSEDVMRAQGSILTNKYAEGYPGRRYYGGCEFIDIIENLAIDRIKAILVQNTPTYNRIPVRKQIWQLTVH